MSKWLKSVALILFTLATVVPLRAEPLDPSSEEGRKAYLSELIQRSVQKKLSGQRYWHLLLHYKKNLLGGYTSLADGPGFFLSPKGRIDPQAELEATLAKFFSDELVGTSQQQAQCAYPARYLWLKKELDFDNQFMPERNCERFKTWIRTLDPESVTLIFPSAYMNSPSSMFGHTLLRIDQKGQTEQTRILAYAINYAADIRPDASAFYQLLGAVGGLKGYLSIMPYYLKVQQYSEMENRDIWEYRLNFNQEQIERMLMHAWELGNTYFDYYFFTENCSYHLLSLLEIADPNLHLTEGSRFWIIPADTIRWVTEVPGLVSEVIYRPSRSTQIQRKRELLRREERMWLKQILNRPETAQEKPFTSLLVLRQSMILDVTYDYLRYQSASSKKNREHYKEMGETLLQVRSALKVPSEEVRITPFTLAPESGHRTARMGTAMGWRGGEPFEEVAFRAAYHDLLDDETGYTPHSQIEVMNVKLRHYNHSHQTRLENLTLVSIASLFPMNSLFRNPSWKFSVGWETLRNDECRYCNYFDLNIGMGGALHPPLLHRGLLYALAELDANYGNAFDPNYRAGVGGTVGLLADITERWKAHLFTTYLSFPVGNRSNDFVVSLHQRYTLSKDLALRLELNRRDPQNEALIRLDVYF